MSPLEDSYHVSITQDLRWGDMDMLKHINNKVYFRYFEDVRVHFFEKIPSYYPYFREHNVGNVLAHIECNFRLPLFYPDKIWIGVKSEVLSPKKFKMHYAIYSENQKTIVADGTGLCIYFDFNSNKSCNIPDVILEEMNIFDKNRNE